MTIAPFAAGTAAADLNTQRLVAMKASLGTISNQIGSGRTADTYGGLGTGRTQSLAAHAQISALDSYIAAAGTGATRVSLASASVQQIATWARIPGAASSAPGPAPAPPPARRCSRSRRASSAAPSTPSTRAPAASTSWAAGHRPGPVESAARILDGDPAAGLDGVRQVIAERQAADLGTGSPKTGRLDLSGSGASVSLSESQSLGVRTNFGFTIAAPSARTRPASRSRSSPGRPRAPPCPSPPSRRTATSCG